MATSATAQTHPYTCNTCQVAYRTADLQRGHMKSEWHRYNLKRRVTSLPPIAADVYTDNILQATAATTAEADKAAFERACHVCQRTYYSQNSYRNHLASQKHKAKQATVGSEAVDVDQIDPVSSSSFLLDRPLPDRKEEAGSDAEQEFVHVTDGLQAATLTDHPFAVKHLSDPKPHEAARQGDDGPAEQAAEDDAASIPVWDDKMCLFCNYRSPDLTANIQHMERLHGMFIPETQYLANLEGLLQHLSQRVHADTQCLYCGKIKATAYAAQMHMRDKGHCMIPYSTEAEQLDVGDFYDFRATYSDNAGSDDESDASDQADKHGEDQGWETDSDGSSVGSTDRPATASQRRRVHKPVQAAYYDEYELHLPSGKSVGHRQFRQYYKQNLVGHPSPEERAEHARLAIEELKRDPDGMDLDGEGGICSHVRAQNHPEHEHGSRSGAVVPRGTAGLAGVSEDQRAVVHREERRGRWQREVMAKRENWVVGKKLNNHKSYYYRYNGGG